MNCYERVKRTIDFSGPDRLPIEGDCRRYASHGDAVFHFPKMKGAEWWLGEGGGVDEWGCKWLSNRPGDMGQIFEHPLKDLKDLDKLSRPNGLDASRYGHLEKELAQRPDAYHVFCNGPVLFERMHFLRGFTELLMDSALDEEGFIRFADWVATYQIQTAEYLAEHFAGKIHALRCTDDLGTQSSSILSPDQFRKLLKPFYAKVARLCHDNGMHFWLHSCGKIDGLLEDLIDAGVDVINPQIDVFDLEELGSRFAGRITFESYPDMQEVVPSGDRKLILDDISRQLKQLATPDGGYIVLTYDADLLKSACDIDDPTLGEFITETYRQRDPFRSWQPVTKVFQFFAVEYRRRRSPAIVDRTAEPAYHTTVKERLMDLIVGRSSGLAGSVRIPPNKSHSFRALIMAGLAEGSSRIIAPSVSNDWMLGTEALEMFGAEVHPHADDVWEIVGVGGGLQTPEDVINCGNSGIILRFFMALAACCDGYTVLTGDRSLRHIRLCQPLIDTLNSFGAWAVSTKGDGHAPVVVRGRLKGGQGRIDGMDSQPVSALLIACSLADAPTELVVDRPGEKSWVGLTLDWLNRCGVQYSNDNFQRYRIRGKSKWDAFEAQIPLDWSAALYPITVAVLTEGSRISLQGMDFQDSQPDKAVVNVLREMGADIEVTPEQVIARSSKLTGREIDCNDFIDQFTLLAVAGTRAEGETVLSNAEVCRYKECDRITATCKALAAMGADIEERPDGLVVRKSELRGAQIDSHSDHRMVMTMAVAAMTAGGESKISDIECIKKTFPAFVEQMQAVGCEMTKRN